jgi:hypothetical protein
VLSGRLATALVVDASADGGPMLPVDLAGGANLVLAAPPTMRSTLVTDSTPPAVALPWPSGPADTLRALSDVRAGEPEHRRRAGPGRRPAAAGATDPRLVVLYTGAPDAGASRPRPSSSGCGRRAWCWRGRVGGDGVAVLDGRRRGTGGMAVAAGPQGSSARSTRSRPRSARGTW